MLQSKFTVAWQRVLAWNGGCLSDVNISEVEWLDILQTEMSECLRLYKSKSLHHCLVFFHQVFPSNVLWGKVVAESVTSRQKWLEITFGGRCPGTRTWRLLHCPHWLCFIKSFPQMCFEGKWLQNRLRADKNDSRSLLAVDFQGHERGGFCIVNTVWWYSSLFRLQLGYTAMPAPWNPSQAVMKVLTWW